MPLAKPVTPTRVFMGRLAHGDDLLEALVRICGAQGITAGRVDAIGAVRMARLAFYDQAEREYRYFELDRPLEITKLMGNISLRDGRPMVHAHVTLSDRDGSAFGGHLAEGTIVFACEYVIEAFAGADFVREYDVATGLALWT